MTGRFECQATPLAGLMVLQRKPLGDQRGYLERLFCHEELKPLLGGKAIRQINHTFTAKKGTIRGMHFQYPPFAETKIVSCLRGEVLDVAVDLRRDSPTFLQWYGEVLSASNHRTLLVPEGFAHGFQTLTDDCEVLYFCTQDYHNEAEGGLNALDPYLAITWPLPVTEQSLRDRQQPLLANNSFQGIAL